MKDNGINVLSLFDGMSCGRIALERAGIKVDNYFASEIDKHAIIISKKNYPEITQLGDVAKWKEWNVDWSSIDLLIGGSPCQGFSFAGKQLAFDDPRSKLFFVFVDILNHVKSKNPNVKFLLENVKMHSDHLDVISKYLETKPVFINSNSVSAQNRKRYYWTDLCDLKEPLDKNIHLKSILDDLPDCPVGIRVRDKSNCIRVGGKNSPFGSKQIWGSPYQRITKKGKIKPGIGKAACLTGGANSGGNHSDMDIIHTSAATRRYSPIECERLQTVPDNYTEGVSNTQRYKMLGNGWTVDVIAHIFKSINQIK